MKKNHLLKVLAPAVALGLVFAPTVEAATPASKAKVVQVKLSAKEAAKKLAPINKNLTNTETNVSDLGGIVADVYAKHPTEKLELNFYNIVVRLLGVSTNELNAAKKQIDQVAAKYGKTSDVTAAYNKVSAINGKIAVLKNQVTDLHTRYTAKPFDVQILGINDFHGQLDTYNSKLNAGGIEYLAAYLKQREATNPNTLLVHAGDAVGASSPVSALLQDEPTIKILNKLGFDVGTLGNHEFDEGVKEMLRLIHGGSHPKTVDKYGPFEGANFPYVSANVVDAVTGKPILAPYVIKNVNGVDIGFIGVTLTGTPEIVTPSGVAGVKFLDEAESINKYTAELKKKGVKAIIVLAHDAALSNLDGSNPSGELVDIANKVDDEVDVMFGAHNHMYTNTVVDGKLLVQSYSYGTAFSDVDLTIDPWTKDIVSKKAEIVTTFRDKIQPDAEIKAMLDKYVADAAPILTRLIGKTTDFISRAENADGESLMGNLIADSMKAQTGTDFALMNAGGVRADIDAGDITWKEAFTVQPFGNDLVTMTLTGAQLKAVFEQQWSGGKTRILKIAGLKEQYNDSLAEGSRVVSLTKTDGTPIDPEKTYTVTVNNFMADGGDGYTVLKEGKNRTVDIVDLDAFVKYISAKGEVKPAIEGRIVKVNK